MKTVENAFTLSALRLNDIVTRFDDYGGRVYFASNEQSGGGSLVIVPAGR